MAEPGSDLVLIARAVRTHGLKGEVVAELLTDFPERFEDLDEVVLVSPRGEQKTGSLEDFWFQKDRVVLKLDGYDDIDAAKQLIGYEFAVPESDRGGVGGAVGERPGVGPWARVRCRRSRA